MQSILFVFSGMNEFYMMQIDTLAKLTKYNYIHQIFFCLLLLCLTYSQQSYAYGYEVCNRPCATACWRPVIAIGAGVINATQLGESQYFPIENTVTDSFYRYSPNNSQKTQGIGDAFLGIEWGLGQTSAALQLGIGYAQTLSPMTVKGTLVQGADVASQSTFQYQYDVTIRQLLLEGKLLGTIACYYHPYIFAGAGSAFNRTSSFSTTVPPFLTFTRQYTSNTATTFTYAVGFGVDMDIDQVFRIGIGYRYSEFGKLDLGNANIDGTPVSGTLTQSNIYTNEVLMQITYAFT